MDAVTAAFAALPREEFLPERQRTRASYDGPLDLGHGQTCSQPRTVAAMLRLLDARPGDRVLDVGAGSGWTTALLAHLVGPTGAVVGVELVPELAAWGEQNVRRASGAWASVRQARPGVLGVPEEARTTGSWCRPSPAGCPPSSSSSSPTRAGWCCRSTA